MLCHMGLTVQLYVSTCACVQRRLPCKLRLRAQDESLQRCHLHTTALVCSCATHLTCFWLVSTHCSSCYCPRTGTTMSPSLRMHCRTTTLMKHHLHASPRQMLCQGGFKKSPKQLVQHSQTRPLSTCVTPPQILHWTKQACAAGRGQPGAEGAVCYHPRC